MDLRNPVLRLCVTNADPSWLHDTNEEKIVRRTEVSVLSMFQS